MAHALNFDNPRHHLNCALDAVQLVRVVDDHLEVNCGLAVLSLNLGARDVRPVRRNRLRNARQEAHLVG